jgi:Predicted membrane protein (DUF2238)
VTKLPSIPVGQAFLGSQGDIWDAQWDMFLVGIGAWVALLTMGRVHPMPPHVPRATHAPTTIHAQVLPRRNVPSTSG